jgi:ribonuclease H2 subunit C
MSVDDDQQESEKQETMRTVGEFDEVTVWGHEALSNAVDDPYVRSIEEWIAVSDKVSILFWTMMKKR